MNARYDYRIETAIYNWVSMYSGLTTIWDKQNEIRPELPYITLNITTITKEGTTDNITYSDGDNFSVEGQRTISLSINVYADNALQVLSKLQSSLEKPTVLSRLNVAGMAVWNIGQINDLSELQETGFQNRSQMDITFGVVSIEEDQIETIDSVELEATVNDTQVSTQIPSQEEPQ